MFTIRTASRLVPRTTTSARLLSTTPCTNKDETPSDHSAGTDTQGDVHSAGKAAAENKSPAGLDSAAQSKGGKSTGESHKDTASAGVGMKDQVGGSGNKGASHAGPKESA